MSHDSSRPCTRLGALTALAGHPSDSQHKQQSSATGNPRSRRFNTLSLTSMDIKYTYTYTKTKHPHTEIKLLIKKKVSVDYRYLLLLMLFSFLFTRSFNISSLKRLKLCVYMWVQCLWRPHEGARSPRVGHRQFPGNSQWDHPTHLCTSLTVYRFRHLFLKIFYFIS